MQRTNQFFFFQFFSSAVQPLPPLLLGPYPGALAGHAFRRLPLAEGQSEMLLRFWCLQGRAAAGSTSEGWVHVAQREPQA